MLVLIGLIIVFASVIGGYLMVNGSMAVLLQPAELVVIIGACFGSIVIGSPFKLLKLVIDQAPVVLKGSPYNRSAFSELLKMQYEIFINVKKSGWLALEGDILTPTSSPIFTKYPFFLHHHHALDFFCGAATLLVNGAAHPDEIELAMDTELETHHEENAIAPGILNKAADSLPGLGIVAAVLGIVVTMQHIDGEPAVIGHHVAAALVGTFLGLLLSYGMVSPLATCIEKIAHDEAKYLQCIRAGLIAFANGAAPGTAVEFARRTVFSFDRPPGIELEKQLREIKPR